MEQQMNKVKTQIVNFPSNEHTTPGYFVQPDDDEKHPALVTIQEWWGLVPHIKDVAERFAREGFIALAPDLYHGKSSVEPDEARKLAMELDRDRAVKEISDAIKHVKGLEAVHPKKIGVVGWCMGGSLTISTAAYSSDLGAAVAFYGFPRDLSIVKNIEAPILGLFAEHDHGISVDMVHFLDEELTQNGVTHEFHIYPGTEHAFFNDTRPHIYNPEAAQDAWEKTLKWFRKYLV
jgi:carboxymethylenebutenolidase